MSGNVVWTNPLAGDDGDDEDAQIASDFFDAETTVPRGGDGDVSPPSIVVSAGTARVGFDDDKQANSPKKKKQKRKIDKNSQAVRADGVFDDDDEPGSPKKKKKSKPSGFDTDGGIKFPVVQWSERRELEQRKLRDAGSPPELDDGDAEYKHTRYEVEDLRFAPAVHRAPWSCSIRPCRS
jgi:hypothetical protein